MPLTPGAGTRSRKQNRGVEGRNQRPAERKEVPMSSRGFSRRAVLAVASLFLLLQIGAAPAGAMPRPEAMAISPDGTRLYLATWVNLFHVLSVIDTATLGVVASLDLRPALAPWGYSEVSSMAISPDGSRLYVGRYDSVTVLDLVAGQEIAR